MFKLNLRALYVISLIRSLLITLIAQQTLTHHTRARALPPPRLLSRAELGTLAHTLAPHVMEIERRGVLRKGFRALDASPQMGRGIRLSADVILTASAWLTLQPQERSIELNIHCATRPELTAVFSVSSRTPPAHSKTNASGAYLLEIERAEGWALLKLSRPLRCSSLALGRQNSERDRSAELIKTRSKLNISSITSDLTPLEAGRTLYLLEPPPRRPTAVSLGLQGVGALEFYRVVSGRLKPGEPLFDDTGRWVALGASVSRDALDRLIGVERSLILPRSALTHALERAVSYLP